MSELVALYALGLLHAGMAGFREAAGRNLLIRKRPYYIRAILRGLGLGQLGALVICLAIAGLSLRSDDPMATVRALGAAGRPALVVYLAFTALVLSAFLPYAIPSVEVRSLTTVAVFGPLTLLLPVAMIGGGVAAYAFTPTAEVAVLFGTAIGAMAVIEPLLAVGGWSKRDAERAMAGG